MAPGASQARSVGWWAMLLAAIALLLFHGTLVAAYVYLRWGHATWPPPGFETPSLIGIAPLAFPVAAAAAMSWSTRMTRRGRRIGPVFGLFAAMGLGTVAAAIRVTAYTDVGFRWDEEAYASLFWVLGGYEITILWFGVIMTVFVLLQARKGLHGPDRSAVLDVATLYWWFAAVTSALSLLTLYLGPYL